jgi:transposase-like protein
VVERTASATSKSAISRRFVAQTAKALQELLARDLGELHIAALLVDGIHVAERCCVVALAILADGTKLPVGLWDGSTENATVVRHLLADLQARGLDPSRGLLVVIDGAKALATAVRSVFGELAVIQRCTVHKRRNVTEHLPDADRGRVDARLARAFNDPDPAKGLRAARALAAELQRAHPGAAASLREGLEEMFTVRRLGVGDRLARTLSSTNPVESMISIARTTARNVKRWRDGEMVRRWVAAGMLNAERSFRRLKGHADMPVLVAALARHAEEVGVRLSA